MHDSGFSLYEIAALIARAKEKEGEAAPIEELYLPPTNKSL